VKYIVVFLFVTLMFSSSCDSRKVADLNQDGNPETIAIVDPLFLAIFERRTIINGENVIFTADLVEMRKTRRRNVILFTTNEKKLGILGIDKNEALSISLELRVFARIDRLEIKLDELLHIKNIAGYTTTFITDVDGVVKRFFPLVDSVDPATSMLSDYLVSFNSRVPNGYSAVRLSDSESNRLTKFIKILAVRVSPFSDLTNNDNEIDAIKNYVLSKIKTDLQGHKTED